MSKAATMVRKATKHAQHATREQHQVDPEALPLDEYRREMRRRLGYDLFSIPYARK